MTKEKSKHISRLLGLLIAIAGLTCNAVPARSSGEAVQARSDGYFTTLINRQTPLIPKNGKIAFVSSDSKTRTATIRTIDPDGSNDTQLTAGPHDREPVWSPDGAHIAFVRTSSTKQKIVVMNGDGSDQTSITNSGDESSPSWSPDGVQIVFSRRDDTVPSSNQIFAVNVDGSSRRRLTDSLYVDQTPKWSPDGANIAFVRIAPFGEGSLVLMKSDGTNQKTIGLNVSMGSWSPDSSKFVYSSGGALIVVDAESGNLTPLTSPAIRSWYDSSPSWSPDGSNITFTRWTNYDSFQDDFTDPEAWLVRSDGTAPKKLTGARALPYVCGWSPDGTKILLQVYDGIQSDLFTINADGGDLTQITHTPDKNEYPASWQTLWSGGCADSISREEESFEANGGTGSIDITAQSDCSWTAASVAPWIRVDTRMGSGSRIINYSVAVNTETSPRSAKLLIAGYLLLVRQAGAQVRINSAQLEGKRLLLFGENFDDGAIILVNGVEQRSRNDKQSPKTMLIGKKAGRWIAIGDRVLVRNPNGTMSAEFIFTGS